MKIKITIWKIYIHATIKKLIIDNVQFYFQLPIIPNIPAAKYKIPQITEYDIKYGKILTY